MTEKNKPKKNFLKRYWLQIILLLLIALLIFIRFFLAKPKPVTGPAVSPTPTKAGTKFLSLTSVEPAQGIHETIWSTYPIKFHFNQPVKEESLKYNVFPAKETVVKFENAKATLIILPKIGWDHKVSYKITIEKLETEDGLTLEKPIIYPFFITSPAENPSW